MSNERKLCRSYASTGGRCELDEGHDGGGVRVKHRRTYPNGHICEWTDELVRNLISAYPGRLD